MTNMQGIKITKLNFLSSNEKGETYTALIDRQGEFIFATRNAGSINGRHYHEGISPTKSPEILILFQGKAQLKAINIKSGEHYEIALEAPCRLEIAPYIWHEISAVTDICFLELNTLDEHKNDTKYDLPAEIHDKQ